MYFSSVSFISERVLGSSTPCFLEHSAFLSTCGFIMISNDFPPLIFHSPWGEKAINEKWDDYQWDDCFNLYNWEMLIPVWDQSPISGLFPNLGTFLIQLFTSLCASNKAETGDSNTYIHVALAP